MEHYISEKYYILWSAWGKGRRKDPGRKVMMGIQISKGTDIYVLDI